MEYTDTTLLSTIVLNFVMLILVGITLYFSNSVEKFSFYNICYAFTIIWVFLILGAQYLLFCRLEFWYILLLYFIPIIFNIILVAKKMYSANLESERRISDYDYNLNSVKYLSFFLMIACIISNLFYVYQEYYLKGIELVAIEQVRSATYQYEKEDPSTFYNLFGRIYLLLLPWFYYLYQRERIHLFTLISFIIISILLSTVFLTRAPILITFVYILLCNYFFFGKKFAMKTNITLGIVALLIFTIITQLIDSNTDSSSNSFFSSFKLYVFGGIVALQNLITGTGLDTPDYYKTDFLYSFDFVYYIIQKVGLIGDYPSYIRSYVDFNGHETNVYTFLDCYYLDFGIPGILLGSAILFYFFLSFYERFRNSKRIDYLQIYLLIFSNLMMCFMNNEFIRISFYISILEIIVMHYLFRLSFKKSI